MNPLSRLAARPRFDERDMPGIMADIESVLRSGKLILGEQTAALESEFAARTGTRHAVAVSSCTAALEIALRAVGASGREVIVPTNTFTATATAALRATKGVNRDVIIPSNTCAATANATLQAGGRIVFAACDDDGNTNTSDILARLTDETAAVVVVHVAGFVPRGFADLVGECKRRGVALVEDCAHAHGARMHGREVGSFGDAGCFSFYPTKITTCGVGGMVTTDRDDVAAYARSLRHHGQGESIEQIVYVGADWLMDEMRAVLLRAQLRRLDETIERRCIVAQSYAHAIIEADDRRITLPPFAPSTEPVYYKFPVALDADARHVRRHMAEYDIEAGSLYWPPVHRMPLFAPLKLSMPLTEGVLSRRLCLPMHTSVDPRDCAEIVNILRVCLDEVAGCEGCA